MARAHEKNARKIVANVLALKGLYIKVGQTLSIMTNFLPEAITAGLEKLQDAVPPHPFQAVEARFVADFGKKPRELFASFDEKPIASASLAQVHVARLKDGTKLAVKLQYPDIDQVVRSDLKTLKRIFGIIDFIFPQYGIKQIYVEGARMILQELDYEIEGKNLETIRDHFVDSPQYVFPKIYWELTTKKVLTASFIDGIKVSHVDELKKASIDPHEVAVSLIHFYCKQIFIDGVYHADPHPGNIIIVPGFKIAMVDYGATAHVPPHMKEGMILFVEGLIKKDTRMISQAMRQMGFIAREENEETFDKIVDYFYGKIKAVKIDDFRKINIAEFQHLNDLLELKKMDISLRELTTTFHVPQDWVMLERTLILMMGLVAHLDPQLNPINTIIPYVEEFVLGKDKKVADLMIQMTKEVMLSYINLPNEILKTLKKLQEGKIVITDKGAVASGEKISAAVNRLTYALLTIAGVGGGYFLENQKIQWAGGFFGILLLVNLLRRK